MTHRKRRDTKQQPSRARSGNQISCSLVSLHFLCDILSTGPVQMKLVDSSNNQRVAKYAYTRLEDSGGNQIFQPLSDFNCFLQCHRKCSSVSLHPQRAAQFSSRSLWKTSLNEHYYFTSLCRHARVSFVEFQAASPAAKQDPHFSAGFVSQWPLFLPSRVTTQSKTSHSCMR